MKSMQIYYIYYYINYKNLNIKTKLFELCKRCNHILMFKIIIKMLLLYVLLCKQIINPAFKLYNKTYVLTYIYILYDYR